MYFLPFSEQATGIVLLADARTRYQADRHPDYLVPFGSLQAAEARAREVAAQGLPVEIGLYDQAEQFLRRRHP
jgi:hypothetical protein